MGGFVLGESVSGSEVAAFAVMLPVIVEMSVEEFEGFMRIVEGGLAADERLARLFERPSPFGQRIELGS